MEMLYKIAINVMSLNVFLCYYFIIKCQNFVYKFVTLINKSPRLLF